MNRATVATPNRGVRRHTGLRAYGYLAPAAVLFTLFLALPIVYALYLSLPHRQGEGSGPRTGCPHGGVGRPGQLPARAARRPGLPGFGGPGGAVRPGAGADDARAGAAVRAAAGRPGRAGSRVLARVDLPAVRRPRGDRLAAVGVPLPAAGQPLPVRGGASGVAAAGRAVAAVGDLRDRQHRPVGRRRLQHDRDLHGAQGDPERGCTRRPGWTAPPRRRSRGGSRCRWSRRR